MVLGGSSVCCGVYVVKGMIIMLLVYVNIGVFIDEGMMVDSYVLVGLCV